MDAIICPSVQGLFASPLPLPQTNSLPPKLKRKTVYFLKLARVPLVKEDFDKQVSIWVRTARVLWHSKPAAVLGMPHCS